MEVVQHQWLNDSLEVGPGAPLATAAWQHTNTRTARHRSLATHRSNVHNLGVRFGWINVTVTSMYVITSDVSRVHKM